MSLNITNDTHSAQVGLFEAPAVTQAAENTSKNPSQTLQQAIQNQSLEGSGKQMVQLLRRHCPNIRLSELPPEVAQMILTSQHETIMEMLETWSQSIQEQAELDQEANKRSTRQKEVMERSLKHRDALIHALAARSGDPAPNLAPEIAPAVQAVVDSTVTVPAQEALTEPLTMTGIQLRDS